MSNALEIANKLDLEIAIATAAAVEIRRLVELNAELVEASKAMRFVFQMMIDNFEIDPDTTCIKAKSKSDVVAEISIADIFKRYDAALAKAKEQA